MKPHKSTKNAAAKSAPQRVANPADKPADKAAAEAALQDAADTATQIDTDQRVDEVEEQAIPDSAEGDGQAIEEQGTDQLAEPVEPFMPSEKDLCAAIADHLDVEPHQVLSAKLYDDRVVAVVHHAAEVRKHTIARGDA